MRVTSIKGEEMPRSKNKVASHGKKNEYLKEAKGYWGARSKVYTIAKTQLIKHVSTLTSTEEPKKENSEISGLSRINAAARLCETILFGTYRIAE